MKNRWILILGIASVAFIGAATLFITLHHGAKATGKPIHTRQAVHPTQATHVSPSTLIPPSDSSPVACTVTVTQYGASTRSANNAPAFQSAIDAGAGGTVCVPPGTWDFETQVIIYSAEVFTGAGTGKTTLMQTVADHNLLQVKGDSTIVQDLTLDTQTYNGGIPFASGASHVTLRNAHVLSGNQPGHFAVYFAGPSGATAAAPRYSTGNTIDNVAINDKICDDGLSWSFQQDGAIRNVSELGSRLALYIDSSTTVDNYSYTPGPCTQADNGFWITPPSENITITNFVSSGEGGKICPNLNGRPCTNITIDNERAKGVLAIGDVTNLIVRRTIVGNIYIFTNTGATGKWESSQPVSALCNHGSIHISGLQCVAR